MHNSVEQQREGNSSKEVSKQMQENRDCSDTAWEGDTGDREVEGWCHRVSRLQMEREQLQRTVQRMQEDLRDVNLKLLVRKSCTSGAICACACLC